MKDYMPKPCHDWTSHGADAFRYFALANKKVKNNGFLSRFTNRSSYDPLEEYE